MAIKSSVNIDFAKIQEKVLAQFQGINPNDPGSWQVLPKYLAYALAAAFTVTVLWAVWLSDVNEELVAEQGKEVILRADYVKKLALTINLDALKKQRVQVMQYVTQLEKQLPSKSEMDALLSEINQAGIGRKLQFELFRPGQVSVKEYYAELPISVKVTGGYHDIGAFVADVANLSRIVTLNNLIVSPVVNRDGVLSLEATASTFRYLDAEEVIVQQKAKAAKEAGSKK
jgi:type IV pilus assembly protein PilO